MPVASTKDRNNAPAECWRGAQQRVMMMPGGAERTSESRANRVLRPCAPPNNPDAIISTLSETEATKSFFEQPPMRRFGHLSQSRPFAMRL